jgi:hypothetical protein
MLVLFPIPQLSRNANAWYHTMWVEAAGQWARVIRARWWGCDEDRMIVLGITVGELFLEEKLCFGINFLKKIRVTLGKLFFSGQAKI